MKVYKVTFVKGEVTGTDEVEAETPTEAQENFEEANPGIVVKDITYLRFKATQRVVRR